MNELKLNLSTEPDYNNLIVAVSIQSPERNQVFSSRDLRFSENLYVLKRDSEQNAKTKKYYDKARAICKCAEACGARLESQRVVNGQLRFVFKFSSLEHLEFFQKNARGMIDEAIEPVAKIDQANERNNGPQIRLITRPDHNNLTSMVSIPILEPDHMVLIKDIDTAHDIFATKRDEADDVQAKICYERARAVCLWAKECGATLESQSVLNGRLQFSFRFPSLESLEFFQDNAFDIIEGVVMSNDFFKQENGRRK